MPRALVNPPSTVLAIKYPSNPLALAAAIAPPVSSSPPGWDHRYGAASPEISAVDWADAENPTPTVALASNLPILIL